VNKREQKTRKAGPGIIEDEDENEDEGEYE
jgi:hypothetical protein